MPAATTSNRESTSKGSPRKDRKIRAFVPKSQIKRTVEKLCAENSTLRVQGAAADLLSSSMEDYCNDVIALAIKLMTYKKRRTLTVDDIKFASTIKQSNNNNLCAGLEVLSLQRAPSKRPYLPARRLDRQHRSQHTQHLNLR